MKERIEYISYDEYGDPFVSFNDGNGSLVSDTSNTVIFTHNFENAGYDHVFRQIDESSGMYIMRHRFDTLHGEGTFDELIKQMGHAGFSQVFGEVPTETDKGVIEDDWDKISPKVTNRKIKEWLDAGE